MIVLYCILGAVAVLFVLYLFLIAPRMFRKPDRTPFLGVHYAHRGLFDNEAGVPENSLKAFARAVEAGYGIELDVQLSKDGHTVVFHDSSLKRMCGVDGNVRDYTLKELQSMRLLNSTETIPTFAEVLAVVGGKVPLIVEYKADLRPDDVCTRADALLQNYKGAYCVESFHPGAVLWYRRNRPSVMRGQLSEEYWKRPAARGNLALLAMQYLLSNVATRPDFIAYEHHGKCNVSRRLCRAFGALSVAWTIKSKQEYEAAKEFYDLFIFDSFRL